MEAARLCSQLLTLAARGCSPTSDPTMSSGFVPRSCKSLRLTIFRISRLLRGAVLLLAAGAARCWSAAVTDVCLAGACSCCICSAGRGGNGGFIAAAALLLHGPPVSATTPVFVCVASSSVLMSITHLLLSCLLSDAGDVVELSAAACNPGNTASTAVMVCSVVLGSDCVLTSWLAGGMRPLHVSTESS